MYLNFGNRFSIFTPNTIPTTRNHERSRAVFLQIPPMLDILPKTPMSFFNKHKKASDPSKISEMVTNRDHRGLIKMLETGEDETIHLMAVIALAKIGGEKALKGLTKALYNPNRSVRWQAAYEMVKIDAPNAQLLIKSIFDDYELRGFQLYSENMDIVHKNTV